MSSGQEIDFEIFSLSKGTAKILTSKFPPNKSINTAHTMLSKVYFNKFAAAFITGLLLSTTASHAKEQKMAEKAVESRYSTPLPLATQGEKIDLLVRVKDSEREHQFNLIFVENRDWPQEKKDHLRRLYEGRASIEPATTPYPVKLRFRLEAQEAGNDFSVDKVVSERSVLYGRSKETEIWRSNIIFRTTLKPGIYRMRIDNLRPASEINFETLLVFERDNRKY